ncbi:MAG: response regulator transcription factor [Lentimicrobiaceae bacterium]|jgi:DNA-binding NarL/FixJ family response regulator|nr:response regulator transcription factor [Lentimicrobiaceae bacterium]
MKFDKLNILIVDDHALFRNGLRMLLMNFLPEATIDEAADGAACIEKIQKQHYDVVMMDIDMPVMDGIQATQKALELKPELQIIALSMHGEAAFYSKMIDVGAKGFLLKNSDIEEVLKAIEKVMEGEYFFSQSLLSQIIVKNRLQNFSENNFNMFSEREKEILALICQGDSNQEISDKLFISKRTAEKHRANIIEKANVKNTAQLVLIAVRNHWIEV